MAQIHGYVCDACRMIFKSEDRISISISNYRNIYSDSQLPPEQQNMEVCDNCFGKIMKTIGNLITGIEEKEKPLDGKS